MSKIVENKSTRLMLTETEPVKYADLLFTVINAPIKQGITTAEMRRDLRIVDVIETSKAKPEIEFTDEDFKFVVDTLKEQTWQVRHIDILDFVDYIQELSN